MAPAAATVAEGQNAARARLLTAADLAERWQVTEHHVYRLAREGRLPVVELGRYKRFRLAVIEAFEAEGGTQQSEKPLRSAAQSGSQPKGREGGRR